MNKIKRNAFGKIFYLIFIIFFANCFLNENPAEADILQISKDIPANNIQIKQENPLITEIKNILENYYLEPERLKNIDWNRVNTLSEEDGIKEIFKNLDPHSAYLKPSHFKMTQENSKKEYGGIGIKINLQPDNPEDLKNKDMKWTDPNGDNCLGFSTVISDVLDDKPAKKAGLIPGDLIIKVNEKNFKGKCPSEVAEEIKGKPDSLVRIVVIREGKEIAFEIIRETIKNDPVNSFLFENKKQTIKIGYLKISNFNVDGTADFLIKKIIELAASGANNLILDLRDNPGGLLTEANLVADVFLKPAVVFEKHKLITTIKDKGKNGEVWYAPYSVSTTDFSPPLFVLINEGSASASEVVAAALQDHKTAIIIGTLTFGKASVQTLFLLKNGGSAKITTGRFFRPNGKTLQGYGVMPDIVIEKNETDQKEVKREKDLEGALKSIGEPPVIPFSDIPKKYRNDFQLMKTLEIIRSFEIIKSKN